MSGAHRLVTCSTIIWPGQPLLYTSPTVVSAGHPTSKRASMSGAYLRVCPYERLARSASVIFMQTALISGASRGIGAATARELGRRGYHVVVNYLKNKEAAQEVVADIVAAGG
ncbi:SDR family NAD(P)-dependent oxidoreductase, partial [Kibdelosporangium lantanae]